MTDGLIVAVRVSRFIASGQVVVLSTDSQHFTLASASPLTDQQVLHAMAQWFETEANKRELQELREDCEAGMPLDNARQAIKDLELLSILDRLKQCTINRV